MMYALLMNSYYGFCEEGPNQIRYSIIEEKAEKNESRSRDSYQVEINDEEYPVTPEPSTEVEASLIMTLK